MTQAPPGHRGEGEQESAPPRTFEHDDGPVFLLDTACVQTVEQHHEIRAVPAVRGRGQRNVRPVKLPEEGRLIVDHDVDLKCVHGVPAGNTIGDVGYRGCGRESCQPTTHAIEPQRGAIVGLLADPEFQGEVVVQKQRIRRQDVLCEPESNAHDGKRFRGVESLGRGHVGLSESLRRWCCEELAQVGDGRTGRVRSPRGGIPQGVVERFVLHIHVVRHVGRTTELTSDPTAVVHLSGYHFCSESPFCLNGG